MSAVAVYYVDGTKRSWTYKVPPGVGPITVGSLVVVPVGPECNPRLAIVAKLDATIKDGIEYKWLIDVVDSTAYFKAKNGVTDAVS